MTRREKRTAQTTVHLQPSLRAALEELVALEQRTLSSVVSRVLERDPHVQLFIQKVGRQVGN